MFSKTLQLVCVAIVILAVCAQEERDPENVNQFCKCPEHSILTLGNTCTDHCKKEVMRCTKDTWIGCFCQEPYRRNPKGDPYCILKCDC